jgi:hypothetical protein
MYPLQKYINLLQNHPKNDKKLFKMHKKSKNDYKNDD